MIDLDEWHQNFGIDIYPVGANEVANDKSQRGTWERFLKGF